MWQVAYTNLLQHDLGPDVIWETSWPEYLLAVISWQQQHTPAEATPESVTVEEAARRVRERRQELRRR
jgi:hypothetical protein